jgi:hypothetical protein
MGEIIGFVVTVLALIVSIVAIVLTTVFYFKSARDLQHITKVIVDYLQMAMNNPDIKPNFDKKGRLINWNVALHPSGETKPQDG